MAGEYEKIEEVEPKIFEWLKGRFLKERLLFSEMAELMLESLKPLGGYRRDAAEGELALLILASRMFNDCEGAKQLLLWGLPDQALPVIRDIIECTLLVRLFLKKPKTAKKWLMSLAEYHPGAVNAKLVELGVDAKEYSLYGVLSHESHSNLLASLSHAQERIVPMNAGEQGTLRTVHFGSARTAETEFFVQQFFLLLFFLLHIALKEPLAELYHQHSKSEVFEAWYGKVDKLLPKLEELTSETTVKPVPGTSQVDHTIQELVKKKMRFDQFKRRVEADGDLPYGN